MVDVTIVEPVPKSFSKSKTHAALAGYISPQVGDVDNKFKAITDALNGIAYIDDKQICEMRVMRRYGETDTGQIAIRIARAGLSVDEMEKALQD
jgi:Holliday junction resolvase RusA-like endonuclease